MLDDRAGFDRLGYDLLRLLPLWASILRYADLGRIKSHQVFDQESLPLPDLSTLSGLADLRKQSTEPRSRDSDWILSLMPGQKGTGMITNFQALLVDFIFFHISRILLDAFDKFAMALLERSRHHSVFLAHVPIGTIFRRLGSTEEFELKSEGAVFVAARGGAGGHGNQFYATSSWQNPVVAEAGGSGEDIQYDVELRLMAHAGLIGLPNAGKSSLLRCLSRARPKVGAYIFTTQQPHVGVLQYADGQQLAVADLPGILAGAHRNYGLGLQFLRHVKRCFCLLFVVDASSRQPLAEQFSCLKEEIRLYDQSLLERPRLVIANKIDIEHASDRVKQLENAISDSELILPVSALRQEGINELGMELRKLLDLQSI
ncbi:hypothetical protein M514_12547 [Trichuris suis]|uniref:Obg family GTPase CgtA n=1 Tax=Trichuris suis TaxID=68888 RepID=A0A085N6F6_9BILA|nr:hypothetical protein M514_12547 [Trichuris suis]